MNYASTDKVFYCKECGHISHICSYTSSVSEWGSVIQGRYGLDFEARDSETTDTYYKCHNCDYEWSGRNEFDETQMTYGEALEQKVSDRGFDELTDAESADYDDIFGEREPPEPRDGRNTLKCPEEVSSDA